jgi:hypothetical protein
MIRAAIALALTGAALFGCGERPPTQGAASTGEQAIVGGSVAAAHPAVGYLVARMNSGPHAGAVVRASCGAVLVAPDAVLTSAACVEERLRAERTVQAVGFDDGTTGPTYEVTGVWREWIHPRFFVAPTGPRTDARFDVAVLKLARAVSDRSPMALNARALEPGELASVIGYGRVTAGDDALSLGAMLEAPEAYPRARRSAVVQIAIERNDIDAYPPDGAFEPGGPCSGDFGAPLLLGDGTVAGVLRGHPREDLDMSVFDDVPLCRADGGSTFANVRFEPVRAFLAQKLDRSTLSP